MMSRNLLRAALRSTTRTSQTRLFSRAAAVKGEDSEYGKIQKQREVNPRVDSRTSTNFPADAIPKVGDKNAPPELISSAASGFKATPKVQDGEDVYELRIDPIVRKGESDDKMRARLQYQSRKRGILETDLLLSTFADVRLPTLTRKQLEEYDRFLDEHDWDIYYWCTQVAPATSAEYAEGAPAEAQMSTTASAGKTPEQSKYGKDEWAQTVGKTKVPFRPIPDRWRDSEILKLLRQHVEDRKAGGKMGTKGLGAMPAL